MKRTFSLLWLVGLMVVFWPMGTWATPVSQEGDPTPTPTDHPVFLTVDSIVTEPFDVVLYDPFKLTVNFRNTTPYLIENLSVTYRDVDEDLALVAWTGTKTDSLSTPGYLTTTTSKELRYLTDEVGRRQIEIIFAYTYTFEGEVVARTQTHAIVFRTVAPTPTPPPSPTTSGTSTPTPETTTSPAAPPSATPIPSATATPPPTLRIMGTQIVNIRSGPGVNYPVVGAGQPNQLFVVVGRNADSTWWQVEIGTGRGWIFDQLATVTSSEGVRPIEDIPTPPPATETPIPPSPTPPPPIAPPITRPSVPLGESSTGGGADPGEPERDALVVEFAGLPVSVPPGAIFSITLTVYNVSPVPVTGTVLTWGHQNPGVVPVGVGTKWFLDSIPPGGQQMVSVKNIYVDDAIPLGLQEIEVGVDYTGATDAAYGRANFLVRQEPESFWLRFLSAILGRDRPQQQP